MQPDVGERDGRRFALALAVVVAVAFAVRVAYVVGLRRDFDPHGDAFFYHAGANLLADGQGFISPFYVPVGLHRAAAEHPPLYLIFLSIPSVLGLTSTLTHQLWSCVAGTATVALIGFAGRKVAGPRAGLLAAAFAALYPNLWIPDGSLQAETLAMFFVALAVLLAYRYRERPSGVRLALVGGACALGALSRSELILLVPVLVVPLAWFTRERPVRERVAWGGAAFAAAIVVIAPWSVYNMTRFTHPEILSAQFGPLLSSANCDSTYYGGLQGYFDINCTAAVDRAHGITLADDESVEDAVNRRAALDYVRGHLSRLPAVEGIRLLRIVGLWHTGNYVRGDWYVEGRRPLWASWASLYTFWGFALLSIGGVVVLRRRAHAPPVFPLLAPVLVTFVTVLLTYASTRFRTTAEPSFAILAAVAVDALYVRLRANRQVTARN